MSLLVEREITVRCDVAHAFATFTTRIDMWWPRGHRRIDGGAMVLEPRDGGRLYERGADGLTRPWGSVTAFEPPTRLRMDWLPGAIALPTTVEILFAAVAGGTRVRVVHREGEAALGERRAHRVKLFARGWDAVLPALAGCAAAPESR